jgi:hypothetical protein
MPTFLIKNGFRFFIYSNESNEPVHVHIEKGEGEGKIWLSPVAVEYMERFKQQEINQVMQIINKETDNFIKQWNKHFGTKTN